MLRVMAGSKRAPDRELLLAQHTFPGEYVIKAFGPNEPVFVDGALKLTLKGDTIVADFLKILDDYVEKRYAASRR